MTPEDIHELTAAIVLAIIAPLLAREAGLLRGTWTKYIVPAGAAALGAFLILDPIVFHGGSFGAEGVQHQLQGAVALGVAAVEFVRAGGKLRHRAWGLALPVGLVVLGMVFVLHSQHGIGALRAQLALHRVLGATTILMAIVMAVEVMGWAKGNWARVGWLLLGVSIALQLALYAEGPAAGGH